MIKEGCFYLLSHLWVERGIEEKPYRRRGSCPCFPFRGQEPNHVWLLRPLESAPYLSSFWILSLSFLHVSLELYLGPWRRGTRFPMLLDTCIFPCDSKSPSGFRLLLLILPLLGCGIVRCQGRARITATTTDSNILVTPGLPRLPCPKSKDPYSCFFPRRSPALGQEATGRQTGWPELAPSALGPTGWPEH